MSEWDGSTIEIRGKVMDHARGAWAGMRPQTFTMTHKPSGFSISWHEHCNRVTCQHEQVKAAVACLQMLVEELRPATPPAPTEGET